MTVSLLHLEETAFTVAGRHQDLILYRDGANRTEVVPTRGTWLGIAEDISGFLEDTAVSVAPGDTILLFTDGVTEATSRAGELFGQNRLERLLKQHADLTPSKLVQRIVAEVEGFQEEQSDDITVVVLRKL
jgi:serine phosphatase RsbU (regulator of sigma subunit)